MEHKVFLEQIERLRVQADRETDAVLRKEHQKTIRHLHKQFRKATMHRNPWYGFLRITGAFFVIFTLALWGATKLVKTYGRNETMGAGWLTIIAFVVISVTMLVMLKMVSPSTYSTVVGGALNALPNLLGQKALSPPVSETSTSETNTTPASPTVTNAIDAKSSIPHVSFDDPPSHPHSSE